MLVNTAPTTGIWEIPGTEKRVEVVSTNLLEGAPNTVALSWLVRKVVSAVAKMLMTTPLMT